MRLYFIPKHTLLGGFLLALFLITGIISCGLIDIYREETFARIGEIMVLVDPGHGGVDGGTSDRWGNLEKDINLAMGQQIARQLQSGGMRVIMTRDRDLALAPFNGQSGRHRRDLQERIRRARERDCLFLVSVHCDWSRDTTESGAKVFYNALEPQSKQLATLIQEDLNKVQTRQRKAAPGKYLIIRQKEVTGVIVEVGFLSNSAEALLLQNERHRTRLALAIARGILRYAQCFMDQSNI